MKSYVVDPNKRKTSTENNFYGVDVNDKAAVQKKYNELQAKHKLFTLVVIVIIGILLFFVGDTIRVMKVGGKPILAISNKVENGTLFKGLGYQVLYCNDGKRYVGATIYETCSEVDVKSFKNVLYERVVDYGRKKKMITDDFKTITFNEVTLDEENDEGGSDYYVEATVECNKGDNCFKTKKEFPDPTNINFIARLNRYNEIYELSYFKTSGAHYDKLVANYQDKVKKYLIDNNQMKEDLVDNYSIKILEDHGQYKFRGVLYNGSYLIQISYFCKDNGNDCITALDDKDSEGDYSNLSFMASMFIDGDDNVSLVGPKEYFNL